MHNTIVQTVADCHAAMASLSVSHPDWMALYEDSPPMTVASLQELLASAPTPFAGGVIIGKLSILREISPL
jgi:hypothetical protein